jgi:hypothetical protein
MTGAAATCTAVALTTGRPCGRRVTAGQTTCRWHPEEQDDLALADELERRHDHREELRRARRARNRAEQPTVLAEPSVSSPMGEPAAGHSDPELVVRSSSPMGEIGELVAASWPPEAPDPDAPDVDGLVWCRTCQRRVTPAVRALHRGDQRAATVEAFAARRVQLGIGGADGFNAMTAQW